MLKYSLILLAVYVLYYAGNIIYDLFLTKQNKFQDHISDEFSLSEFARDAHHEPRVVSIEDVENLRAPKSFLKSEVFPVTDQNLIKSKEDLEKLKNRFDVEHQVEGSVCATDKTDDEILQNNSENMPLIDCKTPEAQKELKKQLEQWNHIVSLAQSSIKVHENIEGHKIYHSVI